MKTMLRLVPSLFTLLAARPSAASAPTFQEFTSNPFVSSVVWVGQFKDKDGPRKPSNYEGAFNRAGWYVRILDEPDYAVGGNREHLWAYVRGVVELSDPESKGSTDDTSRRVVSMNTVSAICTLGVYSAIPGSFVWNGETFTADPRVFPGFPPPLGKITGRITAFEGGRPTSLEWSIGGVSHQITYSYSDDVHPTLPAKITVKGKDDLTSVSISTISTEDVGVPDMYLPSTIFPNGSVTKLLVTTNGVTLSVGDNLNPGVVPSKEQEAARIAILERSKNTNLKTAVLGAAAIAFCFCVFLFMKRRK